MKIAITGSHGVGKTTLVDAVYEKVKNKIDIYKIPEIHRITSQIISPKEQIFTQTKKHTIANIFLQKSIEEKHFNFIADRTVYDTILYYIYGKKIREKWFILKIIDFFKKSYFDYRKEADEYTKNFYNKIILIIADKNIDIDKNDSFRHTEKEKQLEVDLIFQEYFNKYDFGDVLEIINQKDLFNNFDYYVEKISKYFLDK